MSGLKTSWAQVIGEIGRQYCGPYCTVGRLRNENHRLKHVYQWQDILFFLQLLMGTVFWSHALECLHDETFVGCPSFVCPVPWVLRQQLCCHQSLLCWFYMQTCESFFGYNFYLNRCHLVSRRNSRPYAVSNRALIREHSTRRHLHGDIETAQRSSSLDCYMRICNT